VVPAQDDDTRSAPTLVADVVEGRPASPGGTPSQSCNLMVTGCLLAIAHGLAHESAPSPRAASPTSRPGR